MISICSKGTLCEWRLTDLSLLNIYQVLNSYLTVQFNKKNCTFNLAIISETQIALYSKILNEIHIYDLQDKKQVHLLKLQDKEHSFIKQLQLTTQVLCYLDGRYVVVVDLTSKEYSQTIIQREAKLSSLAINDSSKIIAVGDTFGKIYLIHNFKKK